MPLFDRPFSVGFLVVIERVTLSVPFTHEKSFARVLETV
jgi:hypothetical protein